jgi:hypothetical protein
MSRRWRAALLSGLVCPGAGQLYNRQLAKGGLLVAATLGAAGVLFWVLIAAVRAALPQDLETLDPLEVPALATRIMIAVSSRVELLSFGLTLVWIYATVDAWLVGSKRESNNSVRTAANRINTPPKATP